MKSIVDLLLFPGVERGIRSPRHLSIRKEIHVVQLLLKFSFSLLQASLSSVHFFVTFISVKIIDVFSAFTLCFAVRIFPDIPRLSSFLLLVDSDLDFISIEGVLLDCWTFTIGVFSE